MLVLGGLGSLEVEYYEGGESLGHYINEPGIEPVIFLNNTLLDTNQELKEIVYKRLMDFHNSLSEWQRIFPITCCYEELVKDESAEEGLLILGRFTRTQVPCEVCESRVMGYRLIG